MIPKLVTLKRRRHSWCFVNCFLTRFGSVAHWNCDCLTLFMEISMDALNNAEAVLDETINCLELLAIKSDFMSQDELKEELKQTNYDDTLGLVWDSFIDPHYRSLAKQLIRETTMHKLVILNHTFVGEHEFELDLSEVPYHHLKALDLIILLMKKLKSLINVARSSLM